MADERVLRAWEALELGPLWVRLAVPGAEPAGDAEAGGLEVMAGTEVAEVGEVAEGSEAVEPSELTAVAGMVRMATTSRAFCRNNSSELRCGPISLIVEYDVIKSRVLLKLVWSVSQSHRQLFLTIRTSCCQSISKNLK